MKRNWHFLTMFTVNLERQGILLFLFFVTDKAEGLFRDRAVKAA